MANGFDGTVTCHQDSYLKQSFTSFILFEIFWTLKKALADCPAERLLEILVLLKCSLDSVWFCKVEILGALCFRHHLQNALFAPSLTFLTQESCSSQTTQYLLGKQETSVLVALPGNCSCFAIASHLQANGFKSYSHYFI